MDLMKKQSNIEIIKDYIVITIGLILVAAGIQYFYAPNDLAGGGLSGMALIINNYLPNISVGTIIFIGNLILFIIAFLTIGAEFGFRTIYASFGLSIAIDFMSGVLNSHALTTNLPLAVLLGTLMISFGLAIVFLRNSSTGGTDILAKILNKYSTFNIGISLLLVDLIVTVCGGLTFGMKSGIYSLIAVVMNGFLVDKFIEIIEAKRERKVLEASAQA